MTESHLDRLLDELVPAEPREGWDDVVHRARRSQRRYVALVVAIAVLVLAPATWAAVHAFEGTPATPSVKQNFAMLNSMMSQGQVVSVRQGLGGKIKPADVSKAHGVLQVQTPYGPLDLWVAPKVGGKGRCWFLSWEREKSALQKWGGGTCRSPAVPRAGIEVAGPGWDARHPSVVVFDGPVSGPATTLEVKFRDGRTTTLPIVEHFALGVVPYSGNGLTLPSWASETARDGGGKVVAVRKAIPEPVFTAADSRRVARKFRRQWLTDIAQRGKGDPTQRFANLSEAEFRARLAAAAKRYGFTVESVRFLHPRQVAPLVVVRAANTGALLEPFAVGNIFMAIDPAKLQGAEGVRPFEALFFEAKDERGAPFLIAQNEERDLNSGIPDAGGVSWTRDQTAAAPLGMIG